MHVAMRSHEFVVERAWVQVACEAVGLEARKSTLTTAAASTSLSMALRPMGKPWGPKWGITETFSGGRNRNEG